MALYYDLPVFKDVYKITGEKIGIEPLALDKPSFEE